MVCHRPFEIDRIWRSTVWSVEPPGHTRRDNIKLMRPRPKGIIPRTLTSFLPVSWFCMALLRDADKLARRSQVFPPFVMSLLCVTLFSLVRFYFDDVRPLIKIVMHMINSEWATDYHISSPPPLLHIDRLICGCGRFPCSAFPPPRFLYRPTADRFRSPKTPPGDSDCLRYCKARWMSSSSQVSRTDDPKAHKPTQLRLI